MFARYGTPSLSGDELNPTTPPISEDEEDFIDLTDDAEKGSSIGKLKSAIRCK
jgi:hypothetical protein